MCHGRWSSGGHNDDIVPPGAIVTKHALLTFLITLWLESTAGRNPVPSGAATCGQLPTSKSPADWPPMDTGNSPPTSMTRPLPTRSRTGSANITILSPARPWVLHEQYAGHEDARRISEEAQIETARQGPPRTDKISHYEQHAQTGRDSRTHPKTSR